MAKAPPPTIWLVTVPADPGPFVERWGSGRDDARTWYFATYFPKKLTAKLIAGECARMTTATMSTIKMNPAIR
jgi:hypothetical protein